MWSYLELFSHPDFIATDVSPEHKSDRRAPPESPDTDPTGGRYPSSWLRFRAASAAATKADRKP